MLRIVLLTFFLAYVCADSHPALEAEVASYHVYGSSLGVGDTYGDAYAQAQSGVPYDASVYNKNVFKPFRAGDKWRITLMWRKVKN
jgi:hypothetical protein